MVYLKTDESYCPPVKGTSGPLMTGVSSNTHLEVSILSTSYPLNVPVPHHFSYVVRNIPEVTVEQRERALKATHYNEFAFPAAML